MIILLLLLQGLRTVLPGRIFTSKQVTLTIPSGSITFSSANTPAVSSFSIPPEAAPSSVAALALSGYSMSHTNTIYFQAYWQMTGGLFTISLIVSGAMEMRLASYNILFIDSTQSMVRLYNGTLTPGTINVAGSATSNEYFNVYLGNNVDEYSSVYAYLTSFNASVANSNNYIMCYLNVNQTIVPDTVQLYLGKAYSFRTIDQVLYSMLLLNQTALFYTNLPRYHSTLSISVSSLLPQQSSNFGIPPIFANSTPSDFDINCAVSIIYLFVQKNTGGAFRRNDFDITDLSTSINSSPIPGDTIYSYYLVDCFRLDPCTNGTYFDTNTSVCLACVFPCASCLNTTYCLTCSGSYYYLALNHTCNLCTTLNAYCNTCIVDESIGQYNCSSCLLPRYLSNSQCYTCQHYIPNCITCSSQTQCLSCSKGVLLSGLCSIVEGCLFPFVSGTEVTCKYCNITAFFQGTPDSNGKCLCREKYTLSNGICEEICGDGFLLSSARYACDDGNSMNGDGCSSLCETEVGYRCENGSSSSPSACVYVGLPLNLTLVHVRRTDGLNQGVFEFRVYPPLLNIGKMNLSTCVSLDCGTDYQISSLSYASGSLKLTIDYTKNLEGKECNLTLSDWALIRTHNSTLSFQAISENQPLVISTQIPAYNTIKFIFEILGYAALGVFCLSLGHKMIGAELLFAFQTACLANALFSPPSFLYGSVKGLGPVTGFLAFIFSGEDSEVISPFSERYALSSLFLKTEAVVIALLAGAVILWVILTLGQLLAGKASDFDYTHENPDEYPRLSAFARGLYRWLIFPVTAGFLLPLLLGVHIACRRLTPSEEFPLLHINSLALLLCAFVVSGCTICEIGRSRFLAHYQGQPGASRWYPSVFMLRVFVFATLVEVGLPSPGVKWVPYALFVCQLLYTVLLVCFRPYSYALNQVGLLFCEGTVLFSLGLSLSSRFLSVSEMTEVFLLFIFQGVLILCALLCLMRLIVTYYNLLLQSCLMKKEQLSMAIVSVDKKQKQGPIQHEIQQDLCRIVKTNFLKQGHIKISQNPNERQQLSQQEQMEEEENQLQKIKKRLRANLLASKQKNKQKYQT